MKKTLIAFILLFVSSYSYSQSGWFSQNTGTSSTLRTVYFLDSQTGWIGGFSSTLSKTTNGGNNWLPVNWVSSESVLSIYFINALTGWAGGGTESNSHCVITKTTDGGSTWFSQYINNTTGINYKLFFLDENRGWAGCGKGNVLLTTNGGINWTLVQTGTSVNSECCLFLNPNTGFVAGSNGIILKSTNGGYNWSLSQSGTMQPLDEVFFINQTTGLISGGSGIILKTTNQGLTWETKPSGTNQWLYSMKFVDNNTGWAVGGNIPNSSLILQTTNTGETWQQQNTSTYFLYDVCFINSLTGWAAGVNGVLLKTTNGGIAQIAPPQLISPPNNTPDVSTSPTMTWNASQGATNYRIQISTVANFFVISDSASTTNTQYNVPSGKLSAGYTYFWRVNASNNSSTSNWSSIWSFSTSLTPPAPVLISPTNGYIGTSTTPTLNWNAISNAINYKLQISRVPNFTLIIDSATITNNTYIVPSGKLSDNITYFWKVNATNSFGTGPWSNIWSFTPQPTKIQLIGENIPSEYRLYSNYPNPFNPLTKIKFDLPVASNVYLKIFNSQGKEIESIVNRYLSAGSYQVIWNAMSHPSGIYFYTIQTDNFKQSNRMILLK